eukprot:CAMPEP_0172450548 /NCGR_PEP_ID=MMETSP1065-20121228/8835_1 /TAXON_ID=265537 /ORGANISM="Amphiprora paludosa, Strain CCMP125" /LENGTH=716 /DNA_ID=CAMNT_0013202341 /DNA_START=367 /DNA_END=2517 /DNA_ORIENTATION=-
MTNSSPSESSGPTDSLDGQIRDDEVVRSKSYSTESSAEESNDIVVVQPSFDDQGAKSGEWQSRSPDDEDKKEDDCEPRNPSSPSERPRAKQERRGSHTRNLSALFDATSISDEIIGPEHPISLDAELDTRKHRRMFSGDVTNPNTAHRRLNSNGNVAQVNRRPQHHRQPSEGLDILSAAADATKHDLPRGPSPSSPAAWEHSNQNPRPSLGQVSSSSSSFSHGAPPTPHQYGPPVGRPSQHANQMEPPPHRHRAAHYPPPPQSHYMHHYPPGPGGPYQHYPPPHGSPYYHQHYPSGPAHPYPSQYPHRPDYYSQKHNDYNSGSRPPRRQDIESDHFERSPPAHPGEWETGQMQNAPSSSNTQAVQTFVTTIGTADKEKPLASMSYKNTGTNTDPAHIPVPSEVGHHRKLSSFSSLGTILGSSMFASTGSGPESDDPKSKKHHRTTSSSVSFLNGLEVGLDDANFLRNLQASNVSTASTFRSSPPPAVPATTAKEPDTFKQPTARRAHSPPPPPPPRLSSSDEVEETPSSSLKLAAGGTSKRVRRKCTTPGCTNRVVQGGLCISHGAKRKTCKHPGCNKNVKKAGLCSTHGPARKRCEYGDCQKVAVQGGRCIAHGAKKKLCSVDECTKQAILSGMCKKHHDQTKLRKKHGDDYCRPVSQSSGAHKPTHTRGLSIFQEMSADAISSILNDPNAPAAKASQPSPVESSTAAAVSGSMW